MSGNVEALTGQASFALQGRNPDILACIANLGWGDELAARFVPPAFMPFSQEET